MTKERDYSIDLIKIIAMMGVMALHSMIYYIIPGKTGLADILYDMGMVSMPLFFMVSGYLLIPRKTNNYRYVMRKIWGIVRFVTIVVSVFVLFRVLFHKDDFFSVIYEYPHAFIGTGRFYVFWYFTAIMMCYLLVPWLSVLYHRYFKQYAYVTVLLLIVQCFFFSNSLTNKFSGHLFEYDILAIFRIWYTIFYFLLGGMLARIKDVKIHGILVCFLFCIALAYKEVFDKVIGTEFASLFYSSVPVLLLVTCMFIYIKGLEIKNKHARLVIKEMSNLFLPVYAIHSFIIGHLPHHHYDGLACAPLITLFVVMSLSLGISFVLMRIPMMNKIFRI